MLLDEMHDLLLFCWNYNQKAIDLATPLVALYLAYVCGCDQPKHFTHILQVYLPYAINASCQVRSVRLDGKPQEFASDPWIDTLGPYSRERGTTMIRKLAVNLGALLNRQQALFLAPLPGIGNSNPRAIYLSFRTNPNFYYCIYPCFLVCVLESR